MFKSFRIKRKIKKLVKEIEDLEHQRYRSQAALTEAILTNSVPDDKDVDYFNYYTGEITSRRAIIQELSKPKIDKK